MSSFDKKEKLFDLFKDTDMIDQNLNIEIDLTNTQIIKFKESDD